MDDSGAWIDDVSFPAKKTDLIDAAAVSEVPQDLVERLQQLENEQYDSREEVEAELAA